MARLPRIPDLLTTANLACGVGSILLASQGQLTWACWLVFAGALFDVFDGLAARALGGARRWGRSWTVWRTWLRSGWRLLSYSFVRVRCWLGTC
ncbi:MAG: CDP-alcohol phosphatidyltransferase family protein [Flavobacteriales bacterium]